MKNIYNITFAMVVITMFMLMPIHFAQALSVMNGPDVSEVDHDSAKVEWSTQTISNGTLYYGIGDDLTNTFDRTESAFSYSGILANLEPESNYKYYLEVRDGEETIVKDNEGSYYTFTTARNPDAEETTTTETGTTTEETNNDEITNINDANSADGSFSIYSITALPKATSVTIKFSTSVLTTAEIVFKEKSSLEEHKEPFHDYSNEKETTIETLQENTEYEYYIEACDQSDKCKKSEIKYFTTTENEEAYLEIITPEIVEGAQYLYVDDIFVNIKGRAAKNSKITVYLDGKISRTKTLYNSNEFLFNSINLKTQMSENLIKIEAVTDEETLTKEIILIPDRYKPTINNLTTQFFTDDGRFYVAGIAQDDTEITLKASILKNSYAFHTIDSNTNEYYERSGMQTATSIDVKTAAEGIETGNNDGEAVQNILSWASSLETSEGTDREKPAKAVITAGTSGPVETAAAMLAVARMKGFYAKYSEAITSDLAVCVEKNEIDDVTCAPIKSYPFVEIYLNDEERWEVIDVETLTVTQKENGMYVKDDLVLLTLGYDRDAWELGIDSQDELETKITNAIAEGKSDEKIIVELDSQSIYKDGEFNVTLGTLEEGTHLVLLQFIDQAGNTFETQKTVAYDSTPPKFLRPTTLDPYTPTYVPKIEIKGQVDEPAKIYVFVNEEDTTDLSNADGVVETDEDGNFTLPITLLFEGFASLQEVDDISELSKEEITGVTNVKGATAGVGSTTAGVEASTDTATASTGIGIGSKNKVVIIAVDALGQRSEPLEGEIQVGQCSDGGDWKVEIISVTPESIRPREIMEGVASYTIAYKLTWQGAGTTATITSPPTIYGAEVGSALAEDQFDSPADYLALPLSSYITETGTGEYMGVIIANFKPIDVEGETYYEKEENISSHGEGRICVGGNVGLGCFNFLLTLEINYNPSTTGVASGAVVTFGKGDVAGATTQKTMQKHCFYSDILIDKRIDPSVLPEGFLNATIKALNATINFLETISKPLNKITKYTFATCLGMTALELIMRFKTQMSCKWAIASEASGSLGKLLKTAAGQSKLEAVAKQGLCTQYFGEGAKSDNDDDDIESACQSCSDSIKSRDKVIKGRAMICDRVMCPAIPSFQEYVRQQGGGKKTLGTLLDAKTSSMFSSASLIRNPTAPTEISPITGGTLTITDAGFAGSKTVDGQLKLASDCSLVDQRGPKEITKIYDAFKSNKETLNEVCGSPHPYQAQCCAASYDDEWNSIFTFINPLKNSLCLVNPNHEDCGIGTKLSNGIVGICEPGNKNTRIEILTHLRYSQAFVTQNNALDNSVVYLIEFQDDGTTLKKVCRGYLVKDYKVDTSAVKTDDASGVVSIVGDSSFKCLEEIDKTAFDELTEDPDNAKTAKNIEKFTDDLKTQMSTKSTDTQVSNVAEKDKTTKKTTTKEITSTTASNNILKKTGVSFRDEAGKLTTTVPGDAELVKLSYEQVADSVGTIEQKYILQPASSITQSFMGLCLSGINSWIKMTVRILKQLQLCFYSLLMFGDGSAGQCQAIVSQYICDILIEAISCFFKKYSVSGPNTSGNSGMGNWMGAMNDANEGMISGITSRYGEDNIFSNQFSTSSLATSACIFAFTGEWPTSFDEMLDMATDIDIGSIASVYPATRKFQGFGTDGTATFVYNVGMSFFAGSAVQGSLELTCSADNSCTENNNPAGMCDCSVVGEQKLVIPLSQCTPARSTYSFASGDDYSTECFVKIAGTPYRYDKAKFVWNHVATTAGASTVVKTEGETVAAGTEALSGFEQIEIKESASPPLGLCSFDLVMGKYICGIGGNNENYAMFSRVELATPAGASSTQEPVFYLGSTHILDMEIIKKTADDKIAGCVTDCEATNYLSVIIKNQRGAIVYPKQETTTSTTATISPAMKLNGNMRYELGFYNSGDFFEVSGKPFEISLDMFNVQSQINTDYYKLLENGCYGAIADTWGQVTCTNILAAKQGTSNGITLKIAKDAKTKANVVSYCEGPIKEDTSTYSITCEKFINCTGGPNEVTCGDYKINFVAGFLSIPPGTQDIFFKKPDIAKTPTTTFNCQSVNPETWTAELRIFNAIQLSTGQWGVGPQVTTTPDNQQQQKIITFKVSCAVDSAATKDGVKPNILNIAKSQATYIDESNNFGVKSSSMEPDEKVIIYDCGSSTGCFTFNAKVDAEVPTLDITLPGNVLTNVTSVKDITASVTKPLVVNTCPVTGETYANRNCYKTLGEVLSLHLKKGVYKFQVCGTKAATETTELASRPTNKGTTTKSESYNPDFQHERCLFTGLNYNCACADIEEYVCPGGEFISGQCIDFPDSNIQYCTSPGTLKSKDKIVEETMNLVIAEQCYNPLTHECVDEVFEQSPYCGPARLNICTNPDQELFCAPGEKNKCAPMPKNYLKDNIQVDGFLVNNCKAVAFDGAKLEEVGCYDADKLVCLSLETFYPIDTSTISAFCGNDPCCPTGFYGRADFWDVQ